jgi:hypothetical protein
MVKYISMKNKYCLAIHGGAGTISKSLMNATQEAAYKEGLMNALSAGEEVLKKGGTALDAVTAAVKSLEDFPLFNAGRGAVFTNRGEHELDASIMNGINRSAGAIAGVKGIANPIAQVLSGALMLRYSFSMETEAKRIEDAVREVIKNGLRTRDIAEQDSSVVGTDEMGSKIETTIERL